MEVKFDGDFHYADVGEGKPVVLLHGLFGALSNWTGLIEGFRHRYRLILPLLPIYDTKSSVPPTVEGLADFVAEFMNRLRLGPCAIVGNSLGGHVALVLALSSPQMVKALVLTGSSGLFEAGLGSSFPKINNYEYVRERVGYTFYDPATASPELVDEVFSVVNDRNKALRIIKIARAAQKTNMRDKLANVRCPVLLIWGLNDTITPAYVAHEFFTFLPRAELRFIDRCGHAAMMERPDVFNQKLAPFLEKYA
ncbi:MAG: alpha/beta fold hydrolase [Bacteroidia bacterium]|nr:alpha/beta fold hydrolase [Bacteroidia bacterium]MDW8334037.1 alpha/beta fold hydrolase [Bacteroidia bacterium]